MTTTLVNTELYEAMSAVAAIDERIAALEEQRDALYREREKAVRKAATIRRRVEASQ